MHSSVVQRGVAITFGSFMAARIVDGLFSTAGQAVSEIRILLTQNLRPKLSPGWSKVYR